MINLLLVIYFTLGYILALIFYFTSKVEDQPLLCYYIAYDHKLGPVQYRKLVRKSEVWALSRSQFSIQNWRRKNPCQCVLWINLLCRGANILCLSIFFILYTSSFSQLSDLLKTGSFIIVHPRLRMTCLHQKLFMFLQHLY